MPPIRRIRATAMSAQECRPTGPFKFVPELEAAL
jgi:hypothetical protein